jgi:hypothetical protein
MPTSHKVTWIQPAGFFLNQRKGGLIPCLASIFNHSEMGKLATRASAPAKTCQSKFCLLTVAATPVLSLKYLFALNGIRLFPGPASS